MATVRDGGCGRRRGWGPREDPRAPWKQTQGQAERRQDRWHQGPQARGGKGPSSEAPPGGEEVTPPAVDERQLSEDYAILEAAKAQLEGLAKQQQLIQMAVE